MQDVDTTIQTIKDIVNRFRDERDWRQYNDPKSVAEALSIEAAELLEVFLWKDKTEIAKELHENQGFRTTLADEMADVLVYLLELSTDTEIDLSEAVANKIKKNELKYPISKSKGNKVKYTEL